MPAVTLDKDKIYADLKVYFQTDEFTAQFLRLKELSKTCNPFKQTTDGTPQGWADLTEASAILGDLLHDAIARAEKVCADAAMVGMGKEKLEAVAKWLDDIIVLPFYLEPFDGPLIRLLITNVVKLLERIFGKNWVNHVPVPKNQ